MNHKEGKRKDGFSQPTFSEYLHSLCVTILKHAPQPKALGQVNRLVLFNCFGGVFWSAVSAVPRRQ